MSVRGVRSGPGPVSMRSQAIRVANSRMKEVWKSMGPGCPLGAKLYVNPHAEQAIKASKTFGWHATNLHHRDKIEEQITHGKFHKLGKDIYIALPNYPELAVHFGAVGVEIKEGTFEPVLLKVCSSIVAEKNEQFGTYYLPGFADVHILEAYKVSTAYLNYMINPESRPTYFQKMNASLQAGFAAYCKELEKI